VRASTHCRWALTAAGRVGVVCLTARALGNIQTLVTDSVTDFGERFLTGSRS